MISPLLVVGPCVLAASALPFGVPLALPRFLQAGLLANPWD